MLLVSHLPPSDGGRRGGMGGGGGDRLPGDAGRVLASQALEERRRSKGDGAPPPDSQPREDRRARPP